MAQTLGHSSKAETAETRRGQPYIGFFRMLRVLALRSRLRKRDKWTPEQLRRYQQEALKKLREHAYANSPFYSRFHQGFFNAPLKELPILTKAELMKNWDEVVTDRSVKLKDVQDFMTRGEQSGRFRGMYIINATGGTTGMMGIFIYNPGEWLSVVGSYDRAYDWANASASLTRGLKVAVVTTTHPWHQTSAVGSTTRSRLIPSLRIDSTEPLDRIVSKLNLFQPRVLTGYPSMLKLLAREQMEGRLRISPEVVTTCAEVLTTDTRETISKAWGVQAFNGYGSTEAIIAQECTEHRGLHLFEDLVITELVDEKNEPVMPGQYSEKVLVTVLSSRTLPLIRYELLDSVRPAKEMCPCGRPFSLIDGIQGRIEEVVHLTGRSGGLVAIQPLFFDVVMEKVPADGWQIVQDGRSSLRISILNPGASFNEAGLKQTLSSELVRQGAAEPSVELEYSTSLKRTLLGKVILIKAMEAPHG